MSAVQLGTKAAGSVVKISENGSLVNFIVLQHGYPTAGNGYTLLLREAIHSDMVWNSYGSATFSSSAIKMWLNATYYALLDAGIKAQIPTVSIPSISSTYTGAIGSLALKIFLLSFKEVGYSGTNSEGSTIAYFSNTTLRVAKLNGVAAAWWTRTINTANQSTIWAARITSDGGGNSADPMTSAGARPAFCLPSTLYVTDTGAVTLNNAPTAPSAVTVPETVNGGGSITVSWSAASDAEGNLSGYKLERSTDGGSNWVQIYQGTLTTTTDAITFGWGTVTYRVKAYDTEGLESAYTASATRTVVNNYAPGAPPSITVPLTVVGGEALLVSWSAATDADSNLSGYRLERSADGGTSWSQIYQGATLAYQDSITKGWASVTYRVKAYDSYGAESGYTTSAQRTVDNNTAPVIMSGASGSLGTKSAGFSVAYSVGDADTDAVMVTEAIDGVTKRSFTAVLGQEYTFAVTGEYFMTILNGSHTMTVTATDAKGKSAVLPLTFTKAVHALSITLAEATDAEALITKTVMSLVRSIPADATFAVLVTNNANDPSPVWENATNNIVHGLNFVFTNTTAANGHAFNFLITASRGASSTGGFISSIGGAFE